MKYIRYQIFDFCDIKFCIQNNFNEYKLKNIC